MVAIDSHTLLTRCRTLASRASLDANDLSALLAGLELTGAALNELALPDSANSYGRNVILRTPQLEVMVATWTPGVRCAPHDHGGSVGAVLVLQGSGRHSLYRITNRALELVSEDLVTAGEILSFGSELVHAMVDGGSELPLMTLHLYTTAIDGMVVYDVPRRRTLVVDGTCGAWVPSDQSQLTQWSMAGFVEPAAIRGDFSGLDRG